MKKHSDMNRGTAPDKIERRDFLKTATLSTAAAAAVATVTGSFAAPAIAQGAIAWRMQTTWPKNFPGLGTGANKLAELIGRMSGGRLTV